MQATGQLFLTRTRPVAKTATDGCFVLKIFAVDRIAEHQVESWVVMWSGHKAKTFWEQTEDQLVPGAVIHVQTQRMRAHQTGRCVPEIHATATGIELVERQHP